MKKTYKLIGIALLIVIAITIIKNRPKEDLRATADLNEEFSKITFESEVTPKFENVTVDFSVCSEDDSFTTKTASGENSLSIIGFEGDFCIVETTYESPAGNYSNKCAVPASSGEITFESPNFEVISQYCSIKTGEEGILD